jgi:hypothetical protein
VLDYFPYRKADYVGIKRLREFQELSISENRKRVTFGPLRFSA